MGRVVLTSPQADKIAEYARTYAAFGVVELSPVKDVENMIGMIELRFADFLGPRSGKGQVRRVDAMGVVRASDGDGDWGIV